MKTTLTSQWLVIAYERVHLGINCVQSKATAFIEKAFTKLSGQKVLQKKPMGHQKALYYFGKIVSYFDYSSSKNLFQTLPFRGKLIKTTNVKA